MNKPFEYMILDNDTSEQVGEQNNPPSLRDLCDWVKVDDKTSELKQVRTAYIDTRYKAKLRLYNYVTYTRKGLPIPVYKPFEGTDIGINTPILNF